MKGKVYQIELTDKNGVLHIPYELFSFQVFKSKKNAENWAKENLYDSEKEMTMTIKEYNGDDIEDFVVIDEPVATNKKVYCLFVECYWSGGNEYSDIVDVFEDKNSAIVMLQVLKANFANEVALVTHENIMNNENYSITDEETHFLCIDEGMGYSYELWVFEKDLKK